MERSSNRPGEGLCAGTFMSGLILRNVLLIISLILLVGVCSCERPSGRAAASSPSAHTGADKRPSGGSTGPAKGEDGDAAGELFGVSVPMSNYHFARAVVKIFGINAGDRDNEEDRIWDQLLLDYEAFRRGIEAPPDEIDRQIESIIGGKFNRKKDPEAYAAWCKDAMGVSIEMFENMIAHMLRTRELQTQIQDGIDPPVTEKEAHQKFLDQHNTLAVELMEFEKLDDAKAFYRKARANKGFWDREKEKDPKRVKNPVPKGAALEFLMHMWKFPRKAVYEMIEMKVGSIYPPAPIYRGYGVFKITVIRKAKEEDFPKRRESYFEQVRRRKKYEGFQQWLEDMAKEGNVKRTVKPVSARSSS